MNVYCPYLCMWLMGSVWCIVSSDTIKSRQPTTAIIQIQYAIKLDKQWAPSLALQFKHSAFNIIMNTRRHNCNRENAWCTRCISHSHRPNRNRINKQTINFFTYRRFHRKSGNLSLARWKQISIEWMQMNAKCELKMQRRAFFQVSMN